MTREQAKLRFAALVSMYGLQWTAKNVPDPRAWEDLAEVNKVLTEADRREAIGLLP